MAIPGNDLRLGLLPEHRMNWHSLLASYGMLALLVLLLINLGLLLPERLIFNAQRFHVTELIPLPSLRPLPPPVKPPVVHAKLLPPAPVFDKPRLIVPREVSAPRPPQPEVEAPKLVTQTKFMPAVLKAVGGARPALVVHTGEFGSSATPTVNAPIQKVQTGGFGDPNGIPGQGKENARLTMAKAGSFDLPPGAGNGNGAGGANGIRGTVASAGFGNGIAQPGRGDGRSNGRGSVQTAGFGVQETAPAARQPRSLDQGPPTTPVEITYKPNPVYTEEARQLKLEGEVLLEVLFGANGQLHVNRVVRGLGHGLDEAALAAATRIRFKPAQRNGQIVDSTAIVHVVFQLAY